ncbi:interferon regulatory factor 3-like [Spea bombifrons]|uniref:interferon regulatory factor 3-like n=1 Tax=Spea bombifrons TaxID=233779 RepID=UPI00234B8A31|nr:interferon regulatory factor 3-like [Spea bombifrons]XP_053308503.1 interferon regulatory factor 3-like [Spea bombifrons]
MDTQKPRIIPWLVEQIDSQKYPGLVWLNKERTQFRIPWKHGLRHDRSDEDVRIFEAWAIASRSYDPSKDERNPAIWKRNVRSALNRKAGIRVICDNSTNATSPHKIYEMSSGHSVEDDGTAEEVYLNSSPTSDQTCLSSPQSIISLTRNLSDDLMQMQLSHHEEDLYRSPEEMATWPGHPSNPFSVEGDRHSDISLPNVFGPVSVYDELSRHAVTEAQAGSHVTDVPSHQQESVHQHSLAALFPNNTFETQFDVKIYYRGTLIKSKLVKNPRGFCITSRQQENPEGYLEDVSLPIPVINDQVVAKKITELLENLEHGTLIEAREGLICGTRRGKCRSYWSVTETPATRQPNAIDKTDYSVLYSMQQFVTELIEFIEGKRKESPEYSIWVCLGELWPDNRPWKKKLIMVQITPVVMQMLHEMSYHCGASSLHSDELNLQISDSLSFSSTADMLPLLRDIQEMMDFE